MNDIDTKSSEKFIFFNCPHCEIEIEVDRNEINCKIFRCGIFRNTGLPINPHLNKVMCDQLKQNDLIYGCAKPMRIIENNTKVEKCDYI